MIIGNNEAWIVGKVGGFKFEAANAYQLWEGLREAHTRQVGLAKFDDNLKLIKFVSVDVADLLDFAGNDSEFNDPDLMDDLRGVASVFALRKLANENGVGVIKRVVSEWQPLLDSPVIWNLVDDNNRILSKGEAGEPTGAIYKD